MIRGTSKITTASLVPGIRLDLNPWAQRMGTARILRNWIPEKNRVLRKPFAPKFYTSISANSVWAIVDFRYHRANAAESQLLIFHSGGRIFRRTGGGDIQIFPGNTGFEALNARPKPVLLGNRLFFSDSSNAYVYDGRTIRKWGIVRPTAPPVVTVQAGPGITAATGLNASFTWVVLDERNNRVHESSRSDASAFSAALANQTLRLDITGITPPAGVTHWSGYISELNASNVRKRVNTSLITTLLYSATSLPAATNPIEPIRNDPPSASLVMGQWKHRIAMRQENDPRNIWFTAFGEVNSTLAGNGEESVCGKSASSISDLVNEFTFPAFRARLILEHDNSLNIFTEERGHLIIGSGGVLDSLGSRDLISAEQFPQGAAGPSAGVSTPYGLAWMTPGRRIYLWTGGQTVFDIGDAIGAQLDTIPESDLWNVQFFYWDGHGRHWLIVQCNCGSSDDLKTLQNRLFVYDFSLTTEQERPGEWSQELTDHNYTAVGTYLDGDERFLLAGDDAGDVYQLDTICDPTHLNRSAILGKTYLNSSVQSNPASIMRTGLLIPNNDDWATGLYLEIVRGTQDGPSNNLGTNPTVTSAVDVIDPDSAPGISISPGPANTSGEMRTWLKPESGGTEGGALAKQFQFDLSYPLGASNNGEADGRTTAAVDAIYKLGFVWQPKGELSK